MKRVDIEIEFTEELLGTSSADPELHRRFVASKAPDAPSIEEEVAALGAEEVDARGTTVFPRDGQGRPFIYDYQLKGFFKDSCKALWKVSGTQSSRLKAYRQKIDGLVFPEPRRLALELPEGGQVGRCERPLRASTPMGERVALASSECCPAGTRLRARVVLLDDSLLPALKEWLAYGSLRGVGQWRNSGKGRFRVVSLRVESFGGIGEES